MSASRTSFEIVMNSKARSSGKMRCDVSVDLQGVPGVPYELATDEGAYLGGDGTAPPPLALFAAGLAGCLMTQIRSFAKKLRIPLDDVRIDSSCRWQGDFNEDKTYVGSPLGFSLDIDLDSEATHEEIVRLISAAKKGCFIEQTLEQSNVITHRLRLGDGWVDV